MPGLKKLLRAKGVNVLLKSTDKRWSPSRRQHAEENRGYLSGQLRLALPPPPDRCASLSKETEVRQSPALIPGLQLRLMRNVFFLSAPIAANTVVLLLREEVC